MFCRKCGAQLQDNAKFCTKCGSPVSAENTDTSKIAGSIVEKDFDVPIVRNEPEEEKKKGKTWIVVLLAVLAVLLAAGIGIGGYLLLFSDDAKYKKYVTAAEQCIDEENYEEAIGYYLNALRIKDDDADIYVALAEAYDQNAETGEAIRTLETGLENAKNSTIEKLLDAYRSEEGADTASAESEPESVSDASSESEAASDSGEAKEPYTGVRKNVSIDVRQVDTSNFPEILLYASITDDTGNAVDGMDLSDFTIQEIADGTTTNATVNDVYRVINNDHINVNLVMDASGSMSSSSKMVQAKNAAKSLVNQMKLSDGDQVEIISFDDYVYLEQEFTSNHSNLTNAIQNIGLGGSTALYDALYAGLYQTYYESGAKCVIGFTDGAENASSYSYQDVVNMSQNTGIPVFIIGIGEEYDAYALQSLASECSGQYYSANVADLESILEDIYINIYREQQDYYVLKYKTQNTGNVTQFREVVIQTSETSEFTGYYKKSYVPEADITGAFSGSYMNKDFMIADSDQRVVTEADLAGKSLAELRIARNEIFARHGRQFKDNMLNQWFYSKVWYLNLGTKYAPDDFDALSPNPLSKLEIDNANFIKEYEQSIMDNQDIYPNASNTQLSDYDLALSKAVLRTALSQMQNYPSTAILEENKRRVQEAINKEDVRY